MPNYSSLFVNVFSLALLLCFSLLFIPTYSYAQTQISSNGTLSQNSTSGVANKPSSEQYRQLLEKQYFKAGNSLFDQGNYTNAIAYYDKALQINSTDINTLYNKALALDDLGKHDEALTYYGKVLAINPNDIDTLNNKGLLLDRLGKHDETIKYYNK